MVVVVAESLPPAVRGRLKLWFVEPKPNVFVSGVKDSVADDVVKYLHSHCSDSASLVVFQKTNSAPGYKIWTIGFHSRPVVLLSGLQLIQETTT
jgi:CRISPR-associated protein Cas2